MMMMVMMFYGDGGGRAAAAIMYMNKVREFIHFSFLFKFVFVTVVDVLFCFILFCSVFLLFRSFDDPFYSS